MSGSVYKIIELVGSSSTSWEDAAKNAVEIEKSFPCVSHSVNVSFKYEDK